MFKRTLILQKNGNQSSESEEKTYICTYEIQQ